VLSKHLDAGATQFLRIAQLDGEVKRVLVGVGIGLALVVAALLWLTWNYTISIGWIATAAAGAIASWLAPKYLGKYSWAVQLTDPLGALQSHARRWVAVVGTWWLARKIVPPLTKRYLDAGRLSVLNEE
jgi:hypothetical protein